MNSLAFASHVALSSDDIELLHGILQIWCRENKVTADSHTGQMAARSLVDWFQFGITDETHLMTLLDPLEGLVTA